MAFSPRFCTPEQSNCQQTIAGEMCGNETKFSGCLKSNVSFYPGFSTRPCLVHSAGSASPVYGFLRSIQVQFDRHAVNSWTCCNILPKASLSTGVLQNSSNRSVWGMAWCIQSPNIFGSIIILQFYNHVWPEIWRIEPDFQGYLHCRAFD